MKILTAAQMREIDARTIAAGIPGLLLMETAASRVVEFLERRFARSANNASSSSAAKSKQRRR